MITTKLNLLQIIFLCLLVGYTAIGKINLMEVKPWAYQLQNINIEQIKNEISNEIIIIDYSKDGSDINKFSNIEISMIKNSGKYVISYISIGEAENYRYYWKPEWSTNPPQWLEGENPNWPGNFKVRFWYKEWQDIVFNYIDTIISQGFDGIYLDIIDAYYYWSVENPEKKDADKLMCQFVVNIRNHINLKKGNDNFIIIPQNAEDIIEQENVDDDLRNDYLNSINAVGAEDVFFHGEKDEDNDYEPDTYRISILKNYLTLGKQVYSIEYLTDLNKIKQYISAANDNKFVPYTCNRALNQFCPGIATSVRETIFSNLQPYPNPATNIIFFPIKNNYIPEDCKLMDISIYNQIGLIIDNNYKIKFFENGLMLDCSEVNSGNYVLYIRNNNYFDCFRFIVYR